MVRSASARVGNASWRYLVGGGLDVWEHLERDLVSANDVVVGILAEKSTALYSSYVPAHARCRISMSMSRVWPVLLLVASNVFMTIGWYAHLKHHRSTALWVVVLVSWGIALFEYMLQVPANRLGMDAGYSLAQLKTIQEVISLSVFIAFDALYFRQAIGWSQIAGFSLIGLGAAFVFKHW